MKPIPSFIVALSLVANLASAQSKSFTEKRSSNHTYIRSQNFEGIIFSKDFMLPFLSVVSASRRFTPSTEDIESAENLLVKDIKGVNALQLNQGGVKGPVIHENMKKFVRQYFGYYSEAGDKIVYISCLLKDNYDHTTKSPRWMDGAVVVLNGGSNYWQVQANLSKANLFGLDVNNLATE